MKKIFLFLTAIVIFAACQKDNKPASNPSLNPEMISAAKNPKKVTLCHLTENGNFITISVSQNAVPDHLSHGDFVADADGDGHTAPGACTGSKDDCDDNDPNVYPGAPGLGVIANIRLGGQPGDALIGPTCDSDGTYRTCFYVSGTNLPSNTAVYKLIINGVEYPVAFTTTDGAFRVICVVGLPAGETGCDVFIELAPCVSKEVADLYNAPGVCRPANQPGKVTIWENKL